MYSNLIRNTDTIKSTIHFNFIQGPKVEILSPIPAEYLVEFYNKATNTRIGFKTKTRADGWFIYSW